MFLRNLQNLLKASSGSLVQMAGYKNFVMSDTLACLERQCERCCFKPREPPQKVTVLGAGSDVGQIVSLFLKQQKIVKVLALYDDQPENKVLGIANDLSHIDTSTSVEAYQGRSFLKDALYDADVALICGGFYLPSLIHVSERDLFLHNMGFVRTSCLACAQFCPSQTIIVVQTPPVDANFSMCAHTLKLTCKFKPRQILGVNSINAMRANQLFCEATGSDPYASTIPVICGTGRCTSVPVFSAKETSDFPESKCECLTRLVREADDIVCRVNGNAQQAYLSIGFATARFVLNIMKGLFETSTYIDSALVEQADPEKCYGMKFCATPVTIGKDGIIEYAIPTLNESEKNLLEFSKCDLEDQINLGRCYASGDDYYTHPCKIWPWYYYPPSCPVCQPCENEKVTVRK